MNFDIKTEKLSDDQYVISLAGEVDLYTAPEFKQQLLEVIDQGGSDVIVDFSDTTFIDSTTLGVLVGGVKRLRTNDGPALARLQRPQHHEDLRDHRPRPRLHDPRDARRGGRRAAPGRRRPSVRARARRRLAVAARGAGRDRLRHRRAPGRGRRRRRAARSSSSEQCGSCHTLADAGTQGVIGPNLDDAFLCQSRERRARRERRSARSCAGRSPTRSRRPTTGRPGCRPTSSRARTRTRSRPTSPRSRALPVRAPRRRRTTTAADDDGRRRRRAPTARRSSPRRAAAAATSSRPRARPAPIGPNLDEAKPPQGARRRPRHERPGRDAGVRGSAHREQIDAVADVRRRQRRRVARARATCACRIASRSSRRDRRRRA